MIGRVVEASPIVSLSIVVSEGLAQILLRASQAVCGEFSRRLGFYDCPQLTRPFWLIVGTQVVLSAMDRTKTKSKQNKKKVPLWHRTSSPECPPANVYPMLPFH